jgi:hypothetical protein
LPSALTARPTGLLLIGAPAYGDNEVRATSVSLSVLTVETASLLASATYSVLPLPSASAAGCLPTVIVLLTVPLAVWTRTPSCRHG